MKTMQKISVAMVVISLILGGIAFWLFTQVSDAVNNIIFQLIAGCAALLFFVGIAIAIMSKNRADPFDEAFNSFKKEAVNTGAKGGAGEREVGQLVGSQPREGSTDSPSQNKDQPSPPANLSFEEQLKEDKKRYYAQLEKETQELHQPKQTVVEKEAERLASSISAKGTPGASPPTPSFSAPTPSAQKVKVKLELPFFGKKKKKNELREMLEHEAEEQEKVVPWKSK